LALFVLIATFPEAAVVGAEPLASNGEDVLALPMPKAVVVVNTLPAKVIVMLPEKFEL
jgi:hypothetical protein